MKCEKCIHNGLCYLPDNDYVDKKELENCKYFNGWIPVSERLPHEVLDMQDYKQIKVLVCTKNGTVRTAMFGWIKDYNGNFVEWGFIRGLCNVIAWQPLPEPYRP